jgi:2-polyprenyl-3-methyl-5-hydroxy-6-metoxy-1,4-benzoquinol methylase
VSALDRETGRDRYFAAKERELDRLLDPVTGLVSERFARRIACPVCGGERHAELFVKRGYPIVRCEDCTLVFANPQVDEQLVLGEYRAEGESANDLWIDVLTSPRQLELDRAKFTEILDELEPYRGGGRLLDVGTSIGLFLHLARERGWDGIGTEFGRRALSHARDEYGLDVRDRPLAELELEPGSFDVVTLNSVLEHVNRPLELLGEVRPLLRPGGALFLIVPNVDSLACRVLHEHAATFDGRNHLLYFSPSTLRDALVRSGFRTVETHTRLGALDAVLEWLAYREPHSGADLGGDALAGLVGARREEIERRLEELGLGYKLHALAVRTP